jgi:hypothetical protein
VISVFIKSKKFRLCILIFIGIILIIFSVVGFRYFKVYQLKEMISNTKKDSSITICSYKRGDNDLGLILNKQTQLEDNDINIFVQKFLKLPFSYDKSYGNHKNYSYEKDDERIIIYINTKLILDLQKNTKKEMYFLIVNSSHGFDSYKLASDMGDQFFDWLLNQ